ncbi:retrotransposon protein, putative, ty1-copia subclass [Tanacetum coccineum]
MVMGNGNFLNIEVKGIVNSIKLTSGKDLVLSNVLHVPNITKNLISGLILSNKGFKLVIELDKFVITKGGVDNASEVPLENVEPRRSKRVKIMKYFGLDYMTYIVNEEQKTSKAAIESSEEPHWKEAIQNEIDFIVHNNTWKLVDLNSGHKPIGNKWIFKKKLRPDGTI